ncbi:hypothetical protein QV13_05280 [Mesorhizobium hungaricum]|jgi:competence protein CoiA|uniref:Competence protein n=1 Tax=Mesorhizobium hungaricum TaxID=1566387 RepID=A0A1C2E787_9HYPH|nr:MULTISPECIES: competence protein CoiA family protein [Mesorhizobium]OCX22857.1 hypothetical protein QV13_05280 [Mesorhizobium hungaricum]
MRYALIDNHRREAAPGLSGIYCGCGQTMIAKCGSQRIHHWAHKGVRSCDPWWEPETAWHRSWKQQYHTSWQEVIVIEGGQKHIADVRTNAGLVLEFQHSHISPVERQSREAFYGNMIWIVDGTRLKRDLPRFADHRRAFGTTPWRGLFTTPFPDEYFPRDWLDSTVPVFFDFAGIAQLHPNSDVEHRFLWGLLPGRAAGRAVVVAMDRQRLVLATRTRSEILPARKIVAALDARFRAERARAMIRASRHRLRPVWRRRRRTPRF